MKRILFLVKNFIGFGHIRRCLVIAEQISALSPDIDIIFISQAKSLALFLDNKYRVINFPFLQKLPNNSFLYTYRRILDKCIAELKPDMVIEDTYPDDQYLSLPSLQDVPKILVIRRLDPLELEAFRLRGYFRLYERILVMQSKEEFIYQDLIPEFQLLLDLSKLFRFIGPVFHQATEQEISGVRSKYLPQHSKLVVVNAGAGGDHIDDAYCDRLFMVLSQIAHQFLTIDPDVRFVFVTGPYYKGMYPQPSSNIVKVDYEPHLAAMLQIADVAILRPGYNVMFEALAGPAGLIIVPGSSYMERQHSYTRFLVNRYDVDMVDLDNSQAILDLIRKLIGHHPVSKERMLKPGSIEAAAAIIDELDVIHQKYIPNNFLGCMRLLIVVGSSLFTDTEQVKNLFGPILSKLTFVTSKIDSSSNQEIPNLDALMQPLERNSTIFLDSSEDVPLTPAQLLNNGIRVVLFTDHTQFGVNAKKWCSYYHLQSQGILSIELHHLTVYPGIPNQLIYRIIQLSAQKSLACIYLDISHLNSQEEIIMLRTQLEVIVGNKSCQLITLDQSIRELAIQHLA